MNTENKKYIIKTLTKEHQQQVIDLFIKSFCDYEPITHHLKIEKKEYKPFASEVIDKAIKEGLSTVALNQENQVIAFIVAEDIANPFEPSLAHYPHLKPVLDLLSKLSEPFMNGKRFIEGKVAHFWLAGVDKDYMGHGMFSDLNEYTIQMAAKKGFEFAYAEFTNQISEKVTRQFQVIELENRIIYKDFQTKNGQMPFRDVPGGAAAYCAAIKPGIKLDSLEKCYTMDHG